MTEQIKMRRYRIGDFAKYMGVTPDLLKHYENLGLLHSERTGSGYRYYPFYTSAQLLECIRLRNYGMTLREIAEVLSDKRIANEAVQQRLEENMRILHEEITLNELLIEDYRQFKQIEKMLEGRESEWVICRSQEMVFLPHTNGYDFLQDERIYEILREWMAYVPVIKSVMRVDPERGNIWGLAAKREDLESLKIPVNDVVEILPEQKVLLYYFRDQVIPLPSENPDNDRHPAIHLLKKLGLKTTGSYYRISVMPSEWTRGGSNQYGYYAIPILDG